jgi:hypothetical protein
LQNYTEIETELRYGRGSRGNKRKHTEKRSGLKGEDDRGRK